MVEKEGYFEALKADGWNKRHDCALLTSKGQPTDAARDLHRPDRGNQRAVRCS